MRTIEPRTEQDVIRRLAATLNKKRLPPGLLSRLESYIRDAVDGDEDEFRLLRRQASFELYEARQRRQNKKNRTDAQAIDVGSLLDAREVTRARVLSEHLARLALEYPVWDPKVLGFRKQYLEGRALTPTSATEFLTSPALASLSWHLLERSDIPAVGHTSRIASKTQGVDPGGRIPVWERLDFIVDWEGGHYETYCKYSRFEDDLPELKYPDLRGEVAQVRVRPLSPLGELQAIATQLAEKYLWHEAAATWFVLTDIPAPTPAFRAQLEGGYYEDHAQVRLNLSIQPWVSAKTVQRVYRNLQQQLLGHENRHPRLDSLELLGFVAKLRQDGLSWRTCMEEWNRCQPKKLRYNLRDVRNFRRDFESIYRLVVFPDYQVFFWNSPKAAKVKK